MKITNALKEKNNLPLIMFVIIVLRYVPIIIQNAFNKGEVNGDRAIATLILCSIEIILLAFIYITNRKDVKLNIKNIAILGVVMFILGSIQIKNLVQKNFYFSDLYNIGCIFLDIVLFYILLYDFKIEQKSLILFLKGFLIFALIAVIWNLVLFSREILAEAGIFIKDFNYSYLGNPKGFFGNRNILAFIIYLATICDAILINLDSRKKLYIILFFVFWFGIWATHSKTAYIVAVAFVEFYVLLDNKYKVKNKIIIGSIIGILGILGLLNIMGRIPAKVSNNKDMIAKSVVVSDTRIKNLSGRKDIWKSGFEVLNKSPLNYVFGVGRINSIQVLKKFEGKNYKEFHNLYLEIILTGGVIELFYLGFIYFTIIKKIIQSDLEVIYKKIYVLMYALYAVYIMFESLGKFSMGPNDTLCLIFFVAIPLLHANSQKNNISEEISEETNKKG